MAADELRFAVQSFQTRLAGQYVATFPAAPAGWSTGEVAIQSGSELFGGGVLLRRAYWNATRASAEARMIHNNIMVQGMAGVLGRMASQPGAETKQLRIGRDTALVSFSAAERSGEGQLVVGRTLIQVEGRNVDGLEILETLLRSWDLAKGKELAGS